MVAMPDLSASPRPVVTRKDVARLAGVSTAVVSYVVNGGPKNVAPATEEKVRQAIAALGYRPNAAARALKLGSTETLGMIIPEVTNPFFASLAKAVEAEAARRGYALLIANSGGSLTRERQLLGTFAARRVDGVFLSSVLMEPDLSEARRYETPVVLLNHSSGPTDLDSIGVEFGESTRQAVLHLAGHGHREIGLVMGLNVGGELDAREAGWRSGLEAAGLPDGPVFRCPFDRQGGYEAGLRFLAAAHRPTALFLSNDLQAVGFLRAMHEAGVRVPEDVALFSFDDSEESGFTWPPLSTVAQPVPAMAEAAVAALVEPEQSGAVRTLLLPGTLVLRRSCGCSPLP
ncbi:LacI family DNA-binding transcriptional regulator [Arthrobacter sp. NPDC090010]|uniref:LacI family DNA-binding transcriptional regulator n=1 Tax=Arthrobacter sp. NPDC090010 TaxID=3363942 RepID=UPI00381D9998